MPSHGYYSALEASVQLGVTGQQLENVRREGYFSWASQDLSGAWSYPCHEIDGFLCELQGRSVRAFVGDRVIDGLPPIDTTGDRLTREQATELMHLSSHPEEALRWLRPGAHPGAWKDEEGQWRFPRDSVLRLKDRRSRWILEGERTPHPYLQVMPPADYLGRGEAWCRKHGGDFEHEQADNPEYKGVVAVKRKEATVWHDGDGNLVDGPDVSLEYHALLHVSEHYAVTAYEYCFCLVTLCDGEAVGSLWAHGAAAMTPESLQAVKEYWQKVKQR